MIDPFVEQIHRDAQEDSDGRVIAFIVVLVTFGIAGIALYLRFK